MKDCHIHLMPLIGPEDPPAVFMAKAAEAGVAGGTIMSLPPVSFRPDPERSQHWRDRLEHIMQYTSQTPGFHPFFWIDPTEADIFSQISTAVEAGVRGFKCICNHFAPKSCLKQFSAIAETGLTDQDAERTFYHVTEKMVYTIPEKGVAIILYPDDEFSVSVHVDYNSKVIGNQYATFNPGDDFARKISPCRTFVFLHELEPLINMNLIKGGDLDNAIVVVENPVPDEQLDKLKKVFNKPDIEIKAGYLNNLELRCNNELARHKLLDLLGDFALLGVRIKGRVWATRPGHFANTEFMKQLKQTIRRGGEKPRYTYDCRKPPLYDINDIRRMLPHRPPFLLVDRIFHCDSSSVAGIKNVTMNEPFFVGHFPEEPVMPGVLIVEAMAQCSGIMVLSNVPDPENYSTYFMKIDGVKFKRKVVPGDTLQFEIHLLEPIRRGVALVEAKAFVGETLACEAVMMAQVVKNKK